MALYITFIIIIIIIILKAHQHKSAGRNTRLDIQNYGRNGNLLCCGKNCTHCSLQSHGKALEKECCLPGVFRDTGDTPAINIIAMDLRGDAMFISLNVLLNFTADFQKGNISKFVRWHFGEITHVWTLSWHRLDRQRQLDFIIKCSHIFDDCRR